MASETLTVSRTQPKLCIKFNTTPGGATVKLLDVCVPQRGLTRQPDDCTVLVVRATVPRGDIPIVCFQSDRVFLVTDPPRRGDVGGQLRWTDLLTELFTKELVVVCSLVSVVRSKY